MNKWVHEGACRDGGGNCTSEKTCRPRIFEQFGLAPDAAEHNMSY
jgi:hypothetical protein